MDSRYLQRRLLTRAVVVALASTAMPALAQSVPPAD